MNNKIKLGFEQFQQFITDEFNALEAQNESSKLKTIELLHKELQELTSKYNNLSMKYNTISDGYAFLQTNHQYLEDKFQSALVKLESHSKTEKELSIVRENYSSLLNKYNNLNTLRKTQNSGDFETIKKLNYNINSISEELTIQMNINEQLIDVLDKLGYKVSITLPVEKKSAMVVNKENADKIVNLLKKGFYTKYHVEEVVNANTPIPSFDDIWNQIMKSKSTSNKRDSKGRYTKK